MNNLQKQQTVNKQKIWKRNGFKLADKKNLEPIKLVKESNSESAPPWSSPIKKLESVQERRRKNSTDTNETF